MTVGRPRPGSAAARIVVMFVALGIAVWGVLNSAFFAIREVRVVGAHGVATEEILRIAAVSDGDNLITLPTEEVKARLEAHPWIARAMVDRDLPTTVVIRVVERRPGGWVEDPDGVVVVAGDGTILARQETAPPRLPEIGSWPEALSTGERIDGLRGQLAVVSSMSAVLVRRIAAVALVEGDVTLELRDGGEILYGEPGEIAAKNRALARMLRWAAERGIVVRTIDVRVPSAPSLEPAGGDSLPTPVPGV